MNKIVIKEFDRTLLGVDIMLYTVFAVIGYIILKLPELNSVTSIDYVAPLFYMFGFFSLVAYFINRRPNDYEYLVFGLINVLVGSFVLVNSYYPQTGFILGNAVLIYSIAIVLNKGYHTKKLMEARDIRLYPKMAITILLALLGVLVISNLYTALSDQYLILGYYFMTFGLISLFEPLIMIVMRNPKLETFLVSLLEEEPVNEIKTKENKKVELKEIKVKRPVIKPRVPELEENKVKVSKIPSKIKKVIPKAVKKTIKQPASRKTVVKNSNKKK